MQTLEAVFQQQTVGLQLGAWTAGPAWLTAERLECCTWPQQPGPAQSRIEQPLCDDLLHSLHNQTLACSLSQYKDFFSHALLHKQYFTETCEKEKAFDSQILHAS